MMLLAAIPGKINLCRWLKH